MFHLLCHINSYQQEIGHCHFYIKFTHQATACSNVVIPVAVTLNVSSAKPTQSAITYPKLTIETVEQGVKYIQN